MNIQFINPKKNGFTSDPKFILKKMNKEEADLFELLLQSLFHCTDVKQMEFIPGQFVRERVFELDIWSCRFLNEKRIYLLPTSFYTSPMNAKPPNLSQHIIIIGKYTQQQIKVAIENLTVLLGQQNGSYNIQTIQDGASRKTSSRKIG
jgi:hypothetical protein